MRATAVVMGKCLIALGFLLPCGCGGRPPLPDAQLFVGEWWVVDFQSPGGTEDRGQRHKKTVISEVSWSQQFQGETFEDFEYTIRPDKTPKEIDLIYTTPDARRLTTRGIYLFEEGGNRLRVCLGSSSLVKKDGKTAVVESTRPTAFEVKGGLFIIYRRVAK